MRISLCVILAFAILAMPIQNSHSDSAQIPSWIKNNARWWSQGEVGDSDFIKGIQYLIQQGIMQMPQQSNSNIMSVPQQIPSWIKTTAGWWSNDQVGDQDFVNGIQYLVETKIIQINYPFVISSAAFENNGTIPTQYTCDGNNTSPPLTISGVPQKTKSLALTVVDIDAPSGPFTHWVMWNILPNNTSFSEGKTIQFPQGITSAGTHGYKGPCPPFGVHRYFFTLYALDTTFNLGSSATRSDLEQAIHGHIIGKTVLTGTYSKS
jgi:Raf kinase inhibitor-like YbhB/YbcL family protein